MALFGKKKKSKEDCVDEGILSELALRSIHDGVIIVGYDGNVQLINSAALQIVGFANVSEVIGLNHMSVIRLTTKDGKLLDEVANPISLAIKSNNLFETKELDITTVKSNKRVPISLVVIPSDGPGSSKVIVIRDITKELQEDSEKAEFISTASHEMRTPVASIEGYLGLALNPQTATLDERARQYLEKASESSKHLGKLFQNLLDATKLEDKKVKVTPVPVEMISLVKDIFEGQALNITAAGLKYVIDISTRSSSRFAEKKISQLIYAYIDTDLLREVLDNIVENAIKYTSAGGTITTNVHGEMDRVIISVTDTGMGISPDDLAHVFQKFYRADNTDTRTIGGTGLGLYLVKQRVEAMGGTVWAESELGKGTSFFVSVPRVSTEEYNKLVLIAENTKPSAEDSMAPPPNAYTSPIVPVEADASGQQQAVAGTAETLVAANPESKNLAGNLSPEQLSAIKEKFADKIHAEDFKKTMGQKTEPV